MDQEGSPYLFEWIRRVTFTHLSGSGELPLPIRGELEQEGSLYTVKSGIFDGFFDVFLIFLKNEHDKPIGTPNRGL